MAAHEEARTTTTKADDWLPFAPSHWYLFAPPLTTPINRKIVNTAIGRDVIEALADYQFPVLKTAICQRVAFAESAMQGLSVIETDPQGPAAQEITRLAAEIREQFS